MAEAMPFPGALECLGNFVRDGIPVYIISHKTRYPYRGPQYDLHQAAQQWLAQQGFFDSTQVGLASDQVFFELTKQAKLERIAKIRCTHFIDDLPEFLGESDFPPAVKRILFAPHEGYSAENHFYRAASWKEIRALIFHSDHLC
ncbi:hypothetical protein GF339_09885 [candidate division KSB3 bacterium]|uniref:Uncharacterized protein n=1 Tax=candidate division KSB3 bacterium TaxID=2044937 RepID=A0A9D5Q5J2_9BACT|nr:hypothetical protein [candidate division KSB3 bacterium]MBD3324884.1 hypothetical protein [candidate division KSB3 bacterium]